VPVLASSLLPLSSVVEVVKVESVVVDEVSVEENPVLASVDPLVVPPVAVAAAPPTVDVAAAALEVYRSAAVVIGPPEYAVSSIDHVAADAGTETETYAEAPEPEEP
jgi:hypothetical protein